MKTLIIIRDSSIINNFMNNKKAMYDNKLDRFIMRTKKEVL